MNTAPTQIQLEKVILPYLREKSGLVPGKDILIVISPEQFDPGCTDGIINKTLKVVGGMIDSFSKVDNFGIQRFLIQKRR